VPVQASLGEGPAADAWQAYQRRMIGARSSGSTSRPGGRLQRALAHVWYPVDVVTERLREPAPAVGARQREGRRGGHAPRSTSRHLPANKLGARSTTFATQRARHVAARGVPARQRYPTKSAPSGNVVRAPTCPRVRPSSCYWPPRGARLRLRHSEQYKVCCPPTRPLRAATASCCRARGTPTPAAAGGHLAEQ